MNWLKGIYTFGVFGSISGLYYFGCYKRVFIKEVKYPKCSLHICSTLGNSTDDYSSMHTPTIFPIINELMKDELANHFHRGKVRPIAIIHDRTSWLANLQKPRISYGIVNRAGLEVDKIIEDKLNKYNNQQTTSEEFKGHSVEETVCIQTELRFHNMLSLRIAKYKIIPKLIKLYYSKYLPVEDISYHSPIIMEFGKLRTLFLVPILENRMQYDLSGINPPLLNPIKEKQYMMQANLKRKEQFLMKNKLKMNVNELN